VAIVNGYLTLEQIKAAIGETTTDHDADYERAIEAASRQIDEFRGDQFWLQAPTPTPRIYRPDHPDLLWTGDFADTTGLTVATDEDRDGVFETVWDADDWQPEPLWRLNGRPFDRIVACGSKQFPLTYARASVRVVAHWGWAAVPEAVKQACQILAIDHFKSKDLTGGVAGFSDLGAIRVPGFAPQAKALLAPYELP
jgi:hypothetical protein